MLRFELDRNGAVAWCYVTNMATAWQILRDGGVPLAIVGNGGTPRAAELAHALRTVIDEQPSGRDAEALAAWVFAWHHHWPESFAHELADARDDVLAWAQRNAIDDNRYLKLRRIALERLSRVL